MADTGFESVEETKKTNFSIDHHLASSRVLFVVFLLGDKLQTVTLTEKQGKAKVDGIPIGIVNDEVWVGGDTVPLGYSNIKREVFVASAQNADTMFFIINKDDYFVIGSDKIASIQTQGDAQIVIHEDRFLIEAIGKDYVYFNDEHVKGYHNFPIETGTQILTPDFLLEKRPTQWKMTLFTQPVSFKKQNFLRQLPVEEFPVDFPEYRRSPRLNPEAPTDKFKLEKIEAEPKASKNSILKMIIPPIGMLAVTGLMSVLSKGNPLMMMGMGFMSLITAGFTVSQYVSEKKERKVENKNRKENYELYLINMAAQIVRKYKEETKILNFKNPNPQKLAEMIETYDSRIYERMLNNKDFLEVSLGTGDQASQLTVSSDINDKDTDENTLRLKKLVEHFATQRGVPMPLNLVDQTLGLVGNYPVLKTVVSNLLLEVAFFHSYRDVNFLALVPEKSYAHDWADWSLLPHFMLREVNLCGLVRNAQTKEVILNNFYQILVKRKQILADAGKEKPQFAPHYILTIFDDSYLSGHGINEFLAEDMSELGVTVIWCKEDQKLLPETVTALVEYSGKSTGKIVNDHNVYVAKSFSPYAEVSRLSQSLHLLSNLKHVEVAKNSIPESLSLLEQYEVKTTGELKIEERWASAEPNKSIQSLIGWRGKGEPLYWDLHERAHGPHALVGGTTGSGKSEFLTTYLIGLAINFSPEDIGMLVIDWKGGGIANTLDKLPHFMGSITNLDGAGTARALASIHAELTKRQREFAKFGVNNIKDYMSLYKQRLSPKVEVKYPEQPIPHLILVSDEFAELKSNVPEFLDELTSVARIGRSLGVHLILATQKPSGVVNDQIEANSNSKIALKMASEADSNELLKTQDAAHITQAGRGYLKVGQNEVYELFQSGYAGVPYDPEAVTVDTVDKRIYKVTDLGQEKLAYDPDEDVVQGRDTSDCPTQLVAVIEEVNRVFESSNLTLPAKPWLPNLGERLVTQELKASKKLNTVIPLGLLDIPSEQKQEIAFFDIQEKSHTAIFASPGYGKSTVLQTIVMNLARQNTPEQVQFNLLDFGNNGLLPLKDLPHVSDIVMLEEVEKLQKMLERISNTLKERKHLFKNVGVASLDQYESKTGEPLPLILNILDSYDGLGQQDRRKEEIDNLLVQVLREGASLGVYLVMTANRVNSVRVSMSANIQTKMSLFLNDESEVVALFGRSRIMQTDLVGRGQLIFEGQPTALQFYLPVEGGNSSEVLDNLEKEIGQINQNWTGQRPKQIPMTPEELHLEYFEELPEVMQWQKDQKLAFGMSYQTTDILGFIPSVQPYFLLAPVDDDQMLLFQRLLLGQLEKAGNQAILADFNNKFEEVAEIVESIETVQVVNQATDVKALVSSIGDYVIASKKKEQLEKKVLVIADLENFIAVTAFPPERFALMLKQTYKAGLDIIILSPHEYIAKSFDLVPKAIRPLKFTAIVGAKVSNSALIKNAGNVNDPELPMQDAYFVLGGGSTFERMKLPLLDKEE